MLVYVFIDLVTSSPENMGASVYSTREAAEAARQACVAESENDPEYITEIIETVLQS